MSQSEVFAVPTAWANRAQMTAARYDEACARAVRDPDAFWGEVSGRLDWIKPPTRIKDVSFNKEDFHINWFADGELNVAANCLDRHLATRARLIVAFGGHLGPARPGGGNSKDLGLAHATSPRASCGLEVSYTGGP